MIGLLLIAAEILVRLRVERTHLAAHLAGNRAWSRRADVESQPGVDQSDRAVVGHGGKTPQKTRAPILVWQRPIIWPAISPSAIRQI